LPPRIITEHFQEWMKVANHLAGRDLVAITTLAKAVTGRVIVRNPGLDRWTLFVYASHRKPGFLCESIHGHAKATVT